jgi:hypothetical protein
MRKSTYFFCIVATLILMFGLMFGHARSRECSGMVTVASISGLVRELELSDLCLFTEANYTRHPTQADLQTPFQELPMSLEHFPSGSLLAPPAHLKSLYAKHD